MSKFFNYSTALVPVALSEKDIDHIRKALAAARKPAGWKESEYVMSKVEAQQALERIVKEQKATPANLDLLISEVIRGSDVIGESITPLIARLIEFIEANPEAREVRHRIADYNAKQKRLKELQQEVKELEHELKVLNKAINPYGG